MHAPIYIYIRTNIQYIYSRWKYIPEIYIYSIESESESESESEWFFIRHLENPKEFDLAVAANIQHST